MTARVIDQNGLRSLLSTLKAWGFELIGPTVRDQAIVYDEISGIDDLPRGVTDVQEGGRYRLEHRADQSLFAYNVGPNSLKHYFYPSRSELFRARRVNGEIVFRSSVPEDPPKRAFIGVKPCDLTAMAIQDRVFMGTAAVDPIYEAARRGVFVLAANCVEAGATCFCDSMGTGPRASGGYDLVLTEVTPGSEYVVEIGTQKGADLLESIESRTADHSDEERVSHAIAKATQMMGRRLDTDGIRDLLVDNAEHPRWEAVAARCLTCGNCTMACPTCFCSTTEDTVSFDGEAIRSRRWDSCFGLDFSSLHGRPVRSSTRSRYRQWMTHKLATWHDQFGTSGCVGCGRCITWCPVGIDITEEVAAMRMEVRS